MKRCLSSCFVVLSLCFHANAFADSAMPACEVDLDSSINWLNKMEPSLGWQWTGPHQVTTKNYLQVESIFFLKRGINDDDLKYLCHFSELKNLAINSNYFKEDNFTGKGLYHLRSLKNLNWFYLGVKIELSHICLISEMSSITELFLNYKASNTEAGISCLLKFENLKKLILSSPLSEASFQGIQKFTNLEDLTLVGNPMTDEKFKETFCRLPQLESLGVHSDFLNDESLSCLKSFSNLWSLAVYPSVSSRFTGSPQTLTAKGFEVLLELPQFQLLQLGNSKFDDISILNELKSKGVKFTGPVDFVENINEFKREPGLQERILDSFVGSFSKLWN